MSGSSNKEQVLAWIKRQHFTGHVVFDQVLSSAAKEIFKYDDIEVEPFVEANKKRYWNWFKEDIDEESRRGLTPVFAVGDDTSRRMIWYPDILRQSNVRRDKFISTYLNAKPFILRQIDSLSNREYEALGCLACKLLGASKVLLTPPGNEGGIDFIALVNLPSRTTVPFGGTVPLRIVGQCKMYNSRLQVDKVKEFILTLEQVKHQSPMIRDIIPPWFFSAHGLIVGWMISHSGFQAGASNTANAHGVILSDTLDISELVAMSRQIPIFLGPEDRASEMKKQVKNELIAF